MAAYRRAVKKIAGFFSGYQVEHIDRRKNEAADAPNYHIKAWLEQDSGKTNLSMRYDSQGQQDKQAKGY